MEACKPPKPKAARRVARPRCSGWPFNTIRIVAAPRAAGLRGDYCRVRGARLQLPLPL
jgi:hypothetical protein